jgi:exodeoxyribonuclease VII large subunit
MERAPVPSTGRPPVPERASDTTPDSPWPLRLLTHNIGAYLARMPTLWVEAQIVSLKRRPGAGVVFLDLRDTDAEVSMSAMAPVATLDAAGPAVREGARVVLRVEPRFYAKRGTLSLWVQVARPLGEGELLARIEQLKRTLAGEGLFDPARKRQPPFLPRSVGLVCGRGSAAERDVVDNARRRWPAVRIELREVAVQGPTAVAQVGRAITELDALPEVDVIVVARGGGSTEDLLAFSNESLLRTVAACRTPVVSAIGHEVDTPLLDLVADVRASTPTDAARRIVPDAAHELAVLESARDRGRQAVRRRVERERTLLSDLRARPALTDLHGLFRERARALADTRSRLRTATERGVHRRAESLRATLAHLRALSTAATLERGYAIVRTTTGGPGTATAPGHVVRDALEAPAGAMLDVTLARGHLRVAVDHAEPAPDDRSDP